MKKNATPDKDKDEDKDKDKAQSKTKTTKAQKTVAPLTARAQGEAEAGRDKQPNPWLSKQVTQRLEEGRALIIDLATDLPFSAVLRGRVAPPRKEVLAHADPFCQVLQRYGGQLKKPVDLGYIRDREALLGRLSAFEKASENFLGLLRRTRAVISAQMEKAMRDAYAVALEAGAGSPDLARALQPFGQVLGDGAAKEGKKK